MTGPRRGAVLTIAGGMLLAMAAAPCSPGTREPARGGSPVAAQGPSGEAVAAREPVIALPLRPGVTTHFSQGWPPRLLDTAAQLGVGTIRDSVAWAQVEREPGRFAFSAANSGHVDRACARGMTVLLGLEPRNPLYDGGQTVISPAGQAAFARYVHALAERWPHCVIAVEIGNEINGRGGMTGPAATNRIAAHAALLRAVWQAVKPGHPGVALLGGSTNTIATGFLSRLFAAGALQWVDGIAVHPYRPDPEGLDREMERLRAAMRRAGTVRPIWATEFSRDFPDPATAPAYHLKALALLESAGVRRHFWYALADQPAFPTMGLVRLDGSPKPAARAFAFAARELAPLGPAQRVDHGDPALFDVRFGKDTHVVWGAPRALHLPPGARAFAADGSARALPGVLGDEPVVIRGVADIPFGPRRVLADSFYGFGDAPLAWFARGADGNLLALTWVDWEWTGYLGQPAPSAIAANPRAIGTSGSTGTLVRYTHPRATAPATGSAAAAAEPVTAAICLRGAAGATPATAALLLRGQPLWQAAIGPAGLEALVPARLAGGDRLELVVVPRDAGPSARVRYRLRIWRGAGEAVTC